MSPVDWIGAALPEVLSRPQNGPTFYEHVAIDHPDRTVDGI
jgi:hypothetical protein